MSSVVQLRAPLRIRALPRAVNPRAAIVSLFENDDELIGIAKRLYREHGIFTVSDWDRRGPRLLDGFSISGRTKKKFLDAVGVDAKPRRAEIIAFSKERF
ncbi:MAG: hypothetical protein E6R08_08670 [Nevskiaceae bacterium]|nr:MAG: hypothetical protein E6R08_08670 [Nevskiaceae bacterium]